MATDTMEAMAARIDAMPVRRVWSVEDEDFPLELCQPHKWQDWQDGGVPPREWALEEWMPLRQATYLTGPGSAGKSLLAQQLCTCTALGLPFMGVASAMQVQSCCASRDLPADPGPVR